MSNYQFVKASKDADINTAKETLSEAIQIYCLDNSYDTLVVFDCYREPGHVYIPRNLVNVVSRCPMSEEDLRTELLPACCAPIHGCSLFVETCPTTGQRCEANRCEDCGLLWPEMVCPNCRDTRFECEFTYQFISGDGSWSGEKFPSLYDALVSIKERADYNSLTLNVFSVHGEPGLDIELPYRIMTADAVENVNGPQSDWLGNFITVVCDMLKITKGVTIKDTHVFELYGSWMAGASEVVKGRMGELAAEASKLSITIPEYLKFAELAKHINPFTCEFECKHTGCVNCEDLRAKYGLVTRKNCQGCNALILSPEDFCQECIDREVRDHLPERYQTE